MRGSHISVGAGQRGDAGHHGVGGVAAAIDQRCHAVAAELAQRGVGGEAAPAARPLRIPVALLAHLVVGGDVAGRVRHRIAVRLRIGDEGEAAVVGHVEPFVAVGGPRVGQLDAGQQVAVARAGVGPQAEGAVDVHPGAMAVRQRDQCGEVVVGADVQVAGLQQHDGRRIAHPVARPVRASPAPAGRPGRPAGRRSPRVPRPSRRAARVMLPWYWSLLRMRIGGAPNRPSRSTSQPRLAPAARCGPPPAPSRAPSGSRW